jgi:DNA-binding transcriptional LysR family regulator
MLMGMSMPPALDPDLLRTFVLIAEGGSFTEAGTIVGRTQSAVSMQMKRLEELLGQTVLRRARGGTIELTPHGHFLLPRAREMLTLNDSIVAAFREPPLTGAVRLGSPDDYAFAYIPTILRRFAETHPAVQVEVNCLPSGELIRALKSEELDLALISEGYDTFGWASVRLWRGPLHWITATRFAPHRQDPLPLALADRDRYAQAGHDCEWASAAVNALEAAGRRYRIAYTSASQIGTHAPVMAGLAVTVSTLSWLPEGLRAVRNDEGLPALPEFGILMLQAKQPRPAAHALAQRIEDSFRLHMDMSGRSLAAA